MISEVLALSLSKCALVRNWTSIARSAILRPSIERRGRWTWLLYKFTRKFTIDCIKVVWYHPSQYMAVSWKEVGMIMALLSVIVAVLISAGLQPSLRRSRSFNLFCGMACFGVVIAYIAQAVTGNSWWFTPAGIGLWLFTGSIKLFHAYNLCEPRS